MDYSNTANQIDYLAFAHIQLLRQRNSLHLPDDSGQMVVEGWIEQGQSPHILLSLSAPFFSEIDSSTLRNYAVLRAKVTVTGENQSEILTLKPNTTYFPPYYYFGTEIVGKLNSTYTLNIENKGVVYSATTTIPELVRPDSVWFERLITDDTLGLLWIKFTDNAQSVNFYRTQTKRLGKDTRFVPTLTSAFSDELFNGEQITIFRKRGQGSVLEIANDQYYSVGDTVVLKFSSIDKKSYDFWHSVQLNQISSSNPFAASEIKVASNIQDGLGSWCGYASVYDTVIAK